MLLHIIGNIRNVHAERIAVVLLRQGNRIIQIFRIRSVNRHDLPRRQILAALTVSRLYMIRHAQRLVFLPFRKLHGKLHRAGDRKNIRSGIIFISQNLTNGAARMLVSGTVINDFRNDLVAVSCCTGLLRRNVHVAAELYIVGNDKADAFILLVGTDDLTDAAFQDLYDDSLTAAAAGNRQKAHLDFVLIQRTADKIRRNKNICMPGSRLSRACFFLIRNNKTEAARISDKSTRQNFLMTLFLCGRPLYNFILKVK